VSDGTTISGGQAPYPVCNWNIGPRQAMDDTTSIDIVAAGEGVIAGSAGSVVEPWAANDPSFDQTVCIPSTASQPATVGRNVPPLPRSSGGETD
jgi:hypothetical protein